MKLQRDKKLMMNLAEKWTDMRTFEEALGYIDQYLEEHGFHIYPVKKGKSKSINEFSNGDFVIVNNLEHERYSDTGTVIDARPTECLVRFGWLQASDIVVPNEDLLMFVPNKEKGTVSFKQVYHHTDFVIHPNDMVRLVFGSHETGTVVMFTATELRMMVEDNINRKISYGNEEKPSADGEENPYAGFFSPMGVNWKKICFPEEEKSVSYVPWQRCPVCEGNGKKFDTNPFGLLTNLITCPCCEGAMVIPMKRESR